MSKLHIPSTPEFFINMKSIPDEDSAEYEAFFENEKKKCLEGITINGVTFSGWLYWFLNHWNIEIDYEDKNLNEVYKVVAKPYLRELDWKMAEYFEQARIEKKGIIIVGMRNAGKSFWESSIVGRYATFFQQSQNLISAGNESDLALVCKKTDIGLKNVHKYFRFHRIKNDWRKEVVLGNKDKKGIALDWSYIYLRNLDDGKNSEAFAGTRAKSLIIDEIGKFPVIGGYNAAKAAFLTSKGWMCVPILAGTGGSFEKGSEAEEMFHNPDAYKLLAIEDKDEPKRVGFFLPATHRIETLEKSTCAKHFGMLEPSELDDITFYEANEKAGKELTENLRIDARKANDQKTLLKEIMYFPLKSSECFLRNSSNNFPVEEARKRLMTLRSEGRIGQAVELTRDVNGRVTHSFSDKTPITDFPVKRDTRKDGVVMIYEFPVENPPRYLYIAGVDPYNQSSSIYSDSLGTIYVYKRTTDILNGGYKDQIVASYAGRPETMNKWHEIIELIMDFYNAVAMPENENGTFIQYFDNKYKGHMIADGYNMHKEIHPNTSITGRIKGLAATPKVIEYCMNVAIEYCKEPVVIGQNADGSPALMMGVHRIDDPMLLEEIINYNEDGNFDRIVAFRHVVAYAAYLDKNFKTIKLEEDPRNNNLSKPTQTSSPFIYSRLPTAGGSKSPFFLGR